MQLQGGYRGELSNLCNTVLIASVQQGTQTILEWNVINLELWMGSQENTVVCKAEILYYYKQYVKYSILLYLGNIKVLPLQC